MSYKPIHNFRVKDLLKPNDPEKIIYGADLQDEFDSISKEVGALEGQIEGIQEEVQGEIDKIPVMVEEAPEDGVIYGRINRSWIPIQGGGGTGGNLVFWEAILDKPEGIATLGYENTIDGGTYNGRFK